MHEKRFCPFLSREIHPGLNEDILNNLRKLSFSSSMMPEKDEGTDRMTRFLVKFILKLWPFFVEGPEGQDENEIEGTQRHFTRAGKLVSNKQIIYFVPEGDGTQEVRTLIESLFLNLKEKTFSLRSGGIRRTRAFSTTVRPWRPPIRPPSPPRPRPRQPRRRPRRTRTLRLRGDQILCKFH